MLRKVMPGDRLVVTADAYNAFVDAANDLQRRRLNQTGAGSLSVRDADMILVRNDSGADRARFDVLGLDAIVIGPTDNLEQFLNRAVLSGIVPTVAAHAGRFAILAEPIRSGQLGAAWLSGICQARVDIASEADLFADVADEEPANLASSGSGTVQILWKEEGTGVKWAVVRFGSVASPMWFGATTGGGSGANYEVVEVVPLDASTFQPVPDGREATVRNLVEHLCQSHILPVGTVVPVFERADSSGTVRYFTWMYPGFSMVGAGA